VDNPPGRFQGRVLGGYLRVSRTIEVANILMRTFVFSFFARQGSRHAQPRVGLRIGRCGVTSRPRAISGSAAKTGFSAGRLG